MDCKNQLLMATQSELRKGYSSRMHLHDAYSMHFIRAGRADIELEGERITLEEGDCLLVPPFAAHAIEPLPEPGRIQTIRMTVNDPYLDKLCRQIHPPLRGDATLRSLVDCLVESWRQPQPGQGGLTEALLTTLLTLFAVRGSRQPASGSGVIVTEGFSEVTRRILYYVESRIPGAFSLEDLARELNYNKNYLSTVFSGEVGLSIVEYAHFLRIRKAVLTLVYDKTQAALAAERLGFRSMSYFSRIFKRLTGVAPGQFVRAFSGLSREQWRQLVPGEPLLQYRPLRMEQALEAMAHIGQTAQRLSEGQ